MNDNDESSVFSHLPTQEGAPALELLTMASRGDLKFDGKVPSPESLHGAQRGANVGLPLETRSTNQVEIQNRESGDEFFGFDRGGIRNDRPSSETDTTVTLPPEQGVESNSPFRPLYGSSLILEPEETQNQWRPKINLDVVSAPERRVTFSGNVGLDRQGFVRNSLPQKTFAENISSGRDRFAQNGPP
ncbi:hypothetical protein JTB14_028623 [Gonioctena quinquepunctata]|nr:hypothetical protein JTB14_028623 [Gonioctena quinquepunctata]